MSKRRISHQQSNRIHQKQDRLRKRAEMPSEEALRDGVIITRYSRLAIVEDTDAQRHKCSIRPEISSLVSGDRVVWLPEGQHQGVIVSVYPRESVLGRPDARGTYKAVAANISQIMIVIAPIPETSWTLLNSYLVMAETLGIKACIVLNKVDLPCSEIKRQLEADYEPLGYPIVYCSKHDIEATPTNQPHPLQTMLNHHTSVFVGQSGVGKSSIIANLMPETDTIATGDVSRHSNLGRHTTSNSTLYHLNSGGNLIDSPGVREFNLWKMSARDIANGFQEFRPYLGQCQFRNCNHQDAPNCALINAVKQGFVSQHRYEHYLKLVLKA